MGSFLGGFSELEWRGRLVMVAQHAKMAQLAQDLCEFLFLPMLSLIKRLVTPFILHAPRLAFVS